MAFQKVEFEFPEDGGSDDKDFIEVSPSSAEPMSKNTAAKGKVSDDIEGFEVEVVDDTPPADRNRKPSTPPEDVTDDELKDYSEKVRQRIQHFSKGYHDERRAKEEALRERQELEAYAKKLMEENSKLKGTVGQSQKVLIEQAKRNIEAELNSAKQNYRRAYEDGDSEKLMEAQEAMTTAKFKAERLANIAATSLQNKQPSVKTEQQVESGEPQVPTKPRMAPVPVDQKALAWAEKNPWFGEDVEMTSLAQGYHSKLVSSGFDPRSDEYYEAINARMRQLFPDKFGETEIEVKDNPRQRSNVVAPATRSTAPKKVRLTRSQVAIANRLGVPLETYARQVAEEMRKGNG
jgi:hypothetical protein